MAPKLDLNRMRTTFPDNKIDENIDIRGGKAQANQYRNVLLRRVSDYVSEYMGIGVGRPATPADKKAFASTGMSVGAIPDAIIDLDEFESVTDIRLSEVTAMKQGSFDPITLPGAYETKVGGVGDTTIPAITSLKRTLAGEEGQLIQKTMQQFKKPENKQASGPEAIAALFSKPMKAYKDLLILNTKLKFGNYLKIDLADMDKKKGTGTFKFVANPLKNLPVDAFNDPKIFGEYFSVVLKVKPSEAKAIMIITPEAKLYSDITKDIQDATAKISEAHMNIHKVKFSQGLLNNLIQRGIPEKIKSKDAANEYLSLIVGFAKEFERGGLTPFTIRTTYESPLIGRQTFDNIKFKSKRKKDVTQQKFISGAQLSALVQKRLGAIMPKGPERGPPLSPNILTERTGRFRTSVAVLPNYRANVIRFFYDPIYKSLIESQRNPDILVTNTIREVVQGLYARKFNIVRGN